MHDACVQGDEHASAHMWRPEDSFAELVLSALTWVPGLHLGHEDLCPLMGSLLIPSYGYLHLFLHLFTIGNFFSFYLS